MLMNEDSDLKISSLFTVYIMYRNADEPRTERAVSDVLLLDIENFCVLQYYFHVLS